MINNLNAQEMQQLVAKVFAPDTNDTSCLILVDVPDDRTPDSQAWRDRRLIAAEWSTLLNKISEKIGFDGVELLFFRNTGSNNAELPDTVYAWDGPAAQASFSRLTSQGSALALKQVLAKAHIVLCPTEFSATAPMKGLSRELSFKAASMPGFSRAMIPALGIDYEVVHERVMFFKRRLDRAIALEMQFDSSGQVSNLYVDLRNRQAHASSGLLRQRGSAGNLPSGEAFIVPYEGELETSSLTAGTLPVQFENEVVYFQIEQNRATQLTGAGPHFDHESEKLLAEPAYGNIAEIGVGVLQSFGIKPVGVVLLDEKLGLHIAFGRSDHFGGAVSPTDFHNPANVIHIDHVFIPELQPKIKVPEVTLVYADLTREMMIRNSEYLI